MPAAARASAASTLLIPAADSGWRQAVRSFHGTQFSGYASVRYSSFDDYVAEVRRVLDAWASTAEVRIRMEYDDVESFLAEGRYRNQFTTGTSQGAYVPGRRMLVEHTALGIPPSATGLYRPVYGYCTGSLETHPNVVKYGDVVLRFRADVRRRTTFCFGDSLDDIAVLSAHPPYAPQPLTRPNTLALNGNLDLLAASAVWEATPCGYVEAQVHGIVTPRDVDEMVFTLGLQPSVPMTAMMSRYAIRSRTVSGDEP